jgi:hypothetical protein
MVFLHFLDEVRKELKALITGSLLLAGLGIAQSIYGVPVPSWVYVSTVVAFSGWAFFGAWSKQYKKSLALESELSRIKTAKPRIILKNPGAVHITMSNHNFGGVHAYRVPYLRVRFVNDPAFTTPDTKAVDVLAKISFFRGTDNCLNIDGRWSDSTEPSGMHPLASKTPLLKTEFVPSEEHNLDIAYRDGEDGKFYAWNNDNYNYERFRKPEHFLSEEFEEFRVEIRLRGSNVDTKVSFTFKPDYKCGFTFTEPTLQDLL